MSRLEFLWLTSSAFVAGFSWKDLLAQKMTSPLEVGQLADPFDTSNFDPYEFDERRSVCRPLATEPRPIPSLSRRARVAT